MALALPRALTATLLAALLTSGGCVTERTTTPTYGPRSPASHSSTRTPTRTAPTAPVTLPDGPVASRVTPQAAVSTRIRASLMDVGTIPFDGQVLPLVSPDGRFVAAQQGFPPSWPTLLAAPGAEIPHSTRIGAYAVPDPTATPPVVRSLEWSTPLSGVLLGRSCSTTGFLIEAPHPDGSRSIGFVDWVSGARRSLVDAEQGALAGTVNAAAVLGPDGALAFTRRAIDSAAIQLVVRADPDSPAELILNPPPGAGYLSPLFTDEPGIVYAFSYTGTSGAAELHAVKIPQRGDPPTLLVVARQPILASGSPTTVYQMAAAAQSPLPTTLTSPDGNKQPSPRFDKLIFFHAGQGRVAVYDRRLGSMVGLFPGSMASTPVIFDPNDSASPSSGYLITMPTGLEYVTWSQASEFDQRRGVPASTEEGVVVVKGGYVARLTTDPVWRALLVGPAPESGGPKIHLFRLRIESADVALPRGG